MKRALSFNGLIIYGLIILAASSGLIAYVRAQPNPANGSGADDKIQQAQLLIRKGKPLDARTVLAAIPTNAPEYGLAKRYDALALDEANDRWGFLQSMEALPAAPDIPEALSADLTARQIEDMLFYRKFEELLPKARAFRGQHPAAAKAASVREFLLAALFERGMKKTKEASEFSDETIFNKRWPEGKSNLEEFLALVASDGVTKYRALPKRNLKQDVWTAQLILGNEQAVWNEVSPTDVETREQLSFLRLRVHQHLHKDRTEEHLQMADDFLAQFPKSIHCKRVEFETADIALCGGERLTLEARNENNAEIAANKRAAAKRFLEKASESFSRVVENADAGISEADFRESRVAMLRVYFWQRNWAGLSDQATYLINNYPPEGEVWLVAKLYYGAGLSRQDKPAEAAKVLEEALAIGFKNHPTLDGLLISAVQLRIGIARRAGDEALVRRMVEQVQSSACVGSIKRNFLENYGSPGTAPAAPVSN